MPRPTLLRVFENNIMILDEFVAPETTLEAVLLKLRDHLDGKNAMICLGEHAVEHKDGRFISRGRIREAV